MKNKMPLDGLGLGHDSGSVHCDMLKMLCFRTAWGGTFKVHPLLEHSINEVDGFLLLLIYDFRIDFSGLNVGVTHQLACGEQVCAKCQHHCAEGVT